MDLSGMNVLVMGLGLHGGGLEAARFALRRGAGLTVTDLRDGRTLAPSIARLEEAAGGKEIRYVLGRHEEADFRAADLVIKNPGVRPDSPYLRAARDVRTDISLFLEESPARLTAVTGSKGKSSTSSALHWVLSAFCRERASGKEAFLGGNITISPLAFLDGLGPEDEVVLELSSWQLGDLRGRRRSGEPERPLLRPRAALLTSILSDHQDFYGSMEAYVTDKRVICEGQEPTDAMVAPDDAWGRSFLAASRAVPLPWSAEPLPAGTDGGWLTGSGPGFARHAGRTVELVPADPVLPGLHQKGNLLAAGLALLSLGLPADFIRERLGSFPGIEHRMELFLEAGGIGFYNDSAATIPEAAAEAVRTLDGRGRLVLVTGGTDKNLDFAPLAAVAGRAAAVILLAGSGSGKLADLLSGAGISFLGPFDSVIRAAEEAVARAKAGDRVLLSPGCASFGMFLNEFDRGRKWKDAIRSLV